MPGLHNAPVTLDTPDACASWSSTSRFIERCYAKAVPKAAIAYIRVSTQGQGRSGLGLEAQKDAIARFAEAEGFAVAETFTEVETGKGADALERRPKLAAAIKAARKLKAPVIVSKLDRLSRDVHFDCWLMAHKDAFRRPPNWAQTLIPSSYTCLPLAEKERALISERTKKGLGGAQSSAVSSSVAGRLARRRLGARRTCLPSACGRCWPSLLAYRRLQRRRN